MNKKYLLQLGLAFVFLYAGISSFLQPLNWIGFVPNWVSAFGLTQAAALHAHATVEILLGILLLANIKIRLVAAIAALDLAAIILMNGFNPDVFNTTFRDVGLLLTAIYLVAASPNKL